MYIDLSWIAGLGQPLRRCTEQRGRGGPSAPGYVSEVGGVGLGFRGLGLKGLGFGFRGHSVQGLKGLGFRDKI